MSLTFHKSTYPLSQKFVGDLLSCKQLLQTLDHGQSHPAVANDDDDIFKHKFGYVVSCQVYGKMKRNQDSKARDIEQLLHRFPSLRVAYIDEVNRISLINIYHCIMVTVHKA